MKYLILFFFFIFAFYSNNLNASIKENILKNFNDINNLSFEFKQNINNKTEEGNCLIE